MYATAASSRLASLRISSYAVSLLATPCTTSEIESCAARWLVAGDARPDNRPIAKPARCAQTIADPSRMWKPFDSVPSG